MRAGRTGRRSDGRRCDTQPLFEKKDLTGALFRDVNLAGARFENVNLANTVIRQANLANVSVECANIMGLLVEGFRVDQLIEAERDRRDPERARLRIDDPSDPDSVRRVMARLDLVRQQFTAALRSASPDRLRRRPAPDKWSALEHVRHLVFAEDLYLNRWILRGNEPWTRLGLLPAFLADVPAYAAVGTEPSDNLETVLSAWERIHARMRDFLAGLTPESLRRDTSDVDFGQGTVGGVLQVMAHHDLHHLRKAALYAGPDAAASAPVKAPGKA